MRILAVTNMYPCAEFPASGVFIEQQVTGLRSIGVEARVLFANRRVEGPMTYYRLGSRLRSMIAECAPDLVHTMYGGVMAEQIARQPGLPPLVVTFHGSDLLGENLSCFWRKMISRCRVFCSRRAARRAQGVIVVARHLLRALRGDINQSLVRVIPCGIDLERFRPLDHRRCQERLGWAPGSMHVLFATSSGDPVKRPWLARAAVDRVTAEGISAELHLLSGVANTDVPVWLNASDALLLTSQHEGSPTIVKEALACGLPVISVEVGDVAERIQGIEGCFLAEPEPADLALKLRRVHQRRQRLNSRERLEELSCRSVAKRLEQFYRELVDTRCAAADLKSSMKHRLNQRSQNMQRA